MPRLPRLVLPGIAYHLTQRGNRREKTFFEDDDFALYRDLVGGRSVGSSEWIAALEARNGRSLAPGRRGRKPKAVGS